VIWFTEWNTINRSKLLCFRQ